MGDDNYLPKDFDLPRILFDQAHKDIVNDGRIRCVLAAYEKALEDPKFSAPTYFHAAIEALRRV